MDRVSVLMLKRQDLAKEFELVVQQEIKNFNDASYSINQSINEVKDALEHFKNDSLENVALLHSEQVNLKINIENLQEAFQKLSNKFESNLSDQRLINERNCTQINEMVRAINHKISNENYWKHRYDDLSSQFHEEKEKSIALHKASANAMDELTEWTRRAIQKQKDELLDMPAKIDPKLIEMDERLSGHVVDVEGLLKELRIMRKDLFIADKKFEAIFTIIEKLQKQEAIP